MTTGITGKPPTGSVPAAIHHYRFSERHSLPEKRRLSKAVAAMSTIAGLNRRYFMNLRPDYGFSLYPQWISTPQHVHRIAAVQDMTARERAGSTAPAPVPRKP